MPILLYTIAIRSSRDSDRSSALQKSFALHTTSSCCDLMSAQTKGTTPRYMPVSPKPDAF
jgi:hypothetical protein